MGTHFKYENRYPDSLKNKFNSALNKSLSEKEKINNKYDRAVLNTDYVISEIISSVQQKASNSAVLYLSDHGEELDNLKFRGHNESFATKSMFEIPFFVWQSQENKKNNPLFFDNDRKYMSDDLFHTLADFLQINSDEVDSTRSIFSRSFKNRKRLVLDFQNYDSIFRN
jgi:heptose-I-phosphate ethanolaminephosphotransferase